MELWTSLAFLAAWGSIQLTYASTQAPQVDITQRSIQWSNNPNPSSADPYLLNVIVNSRFNFTAAVDTGSTGFLVSAADLNFTNDSELKRCCAPAFEYLSSSRRYYQGYWFPSNLSFISVAGTNVQSAVPIFAVTERGTCSVYMNGTCTKNTSVVMPTGTRYMGVGFGRLNDEQPDATADKNPLLNVDFQGTTGISSGYVIGASGIIVGVRAEELADGWMLSNLTRNYEAGARVNRPEWKGTPMCVQVAGSECFTGTALLDTGIDYSFLGVPNNATTNVKVQQSGLWVLKNGTDVTVKFGNPGQHAVNYSFIVGTPNSKSNTTPGRVVLSREHDDGAFINTGRLFYNGYSVLFDELSGTVGLKKSMSNSTYNNRGHKHQSNQMTLMTVMCHIGSLIYQLLV